MNIQKIMSTPAVCCEADVALNRAAQLMWEHDCGAICVTNANGELAGVITDRDICMATYTQGKPPQEILVADVMAKKVFTCDPGDSLESVERLMRENRVRRAPVVNTQNHPIGVIALNDIARHAAASEKTGNRDEFVRTIAAVCEPRANARS